MLFNLDAHSIWCRRPCGLHVSTSFKTKINVPYSC